MLARKHLLSLLLAITPVTLLLSGCEGAATLGMTPNQWNQLSSQQQQTAINHYHEILNNLQQKTVKQNNKTADTNLMVDTPNDPVINLSIRSGSAAFPTNFRPFTDIAPLNVVLNPNSCTKQSLHSKDLSQSTNIWFCYVNHMVGIDPSFYRLNQAWGTLFININPLWDQGLAYNHLYSSGYASLSNATIYIKSQTPVNLSPQVVDITNAVLQQPVATNSIKAINSLTTLDNSDN